MTAAPEAGADEMDARRGSGTRNPAYRGFQCLRLTTHLTGSSEVEQRKG